VTYPEPTQVTDTVNLIWVILAAITLLITIIGAAITIHRNIDKNTARIDHLDRFSSDQIGHLRLRTDSLQSEDEKIRGLVDHRNDRTLNELKKVEEQIKQHFEISMYIKTTLDHIMNGNINLNQTSKKP
jgi:hypothetical protein